MSSLDSAVFQLASPESPTSPTSQSNATWFSNTPETDRAWDEFPNGRWGDSRSPAYGEMDGYGASLKMTVSRAHCWIAAWEHVDTLELLLPSTMAGKQIKYLQKSLFDPSVLLLRLPKPSNSRMKLSELGVIR